MSKFPSPTNEPETPAQRKHAVANILESQEHVRAIRRYYVCLIQEEEQRRAEFVARVEEASAKLAKFEGELSIAPSKIEAMDHELGRLTKRLTRVKHSVQIEKLRALKLKIESELQGVEQISD